MSVLTMTENGDWCLDPDLEPFEFWGYTTLVQERIFSAPMTKAVEELQKKLVLYFHEAGIHAYEENKSVFALRDPRFGLVGQPKTFYFGFKDLMFHVGMSIRPDDHKKPLVKGSYKTPMQKMRDAIEDVDITR